MAISKAPTDRCPQSLSQLRGVDPRSLFNHDLPRAAQFQLFADPWLERAKENSAHGEWFEAFIYLWVAFNAWLALAVTWREYSDQDWYLWRAASLDPVLTDRFNGQWLKNPNFRESAAEFHSLLPVFKARTLVEKGLEAWGAWNSGEPRTAFRRRCFAIGLEPTDFSPSCFLLHQPVPDHPLDSTPDLVPLDWPHVLAAIYTVRCNLLHGGKSYLSSSDRGFVRLAYSVLASVWDGG